MSHFAEIDENNVVIRVLVGDNSLPDEGKSFFETHLGGTWVQTSYNHNFRARYAGVGYSYDSERDVFISPKPFPSWILNEITTEWEAPTPLPVEEGKFFIWNEETLSWEHLEPLE